MEKFGWTWTSPSPWRRLRRGWTSPSCPASPHLFTSGTSLCQAHHSLTYLFPYGRNFFRSDTSLCQIPLRARYLCTSRTSLVTHLFMPGSAANVLRFESKAPHPPPRGRLPRLGLPPNSTKDGSIHRLSQHARTLFLAFMGMGSMLYLAANPVMPWGWGSIRRLVPPKLSIRPKRVSAFSPCLLRVSPCRYR